jgi:hypothetical protein
MDTNLDPEGCCFAVIGDGQDAPGACFEDLEDAIAWGLDRYGGDRFAIRHVELYVATGRPPLAACS